MGAMLYGTSPLAPLRCAAVPVVLGAIALVAVYLPARRASRVDPVEALRADV
jgi:ABC-type lipoprotein release transport system permease subunit